MLPGIIGSAIGAIDGILDKFVEDKGAEAQREADLLKERLKVEMLRIEQEHAVQLKQIEVNMQEAQHPSIYVAGARPAILWIGAAAFGYVLIVRDLLIMTFGMDPASLPEVDSVLLMTVLGGVLGIGGMRTYEKTKGVETRAMLRPRLKPRR